LDELEERAGHGGGLRGLASGFPDLDDITGGFRRGDLVVLAGRPSMGKTQLALNIASHAALAEAAGVLVFTFEMSREAAAQRMLAAAAQVAGERLDRGRLEPGEWKRLLEACERLAPARLYVDQSASTIPGIRAKAERLLARPGGLGLLVVDYLQLVQPDRQGQSRTEEVSQITRGLKLVAQDLDIPVLALAQLNR